MPYFEDDKIKLYYEIVTQSENSPTILFLSGFAADHHFWQPVIPLLAEKYNLLLIDNPGAGQSSLSSEASTRQMASDVAKLIKHLKLDNVHVLAHGIGGMMAQWLAIDHPALLSKLIFIFYYWASTRYATHGI